jgi:hypothetical protein
MRFWGVENFIDDLLMGYKHDKVDQKSARYTKNHNFFGQRTKSSSKVLLKLDFELFYDDL